MPSSLHSLTFEATDPVRLATFWGDVLDRPVDGTVVLPSDGEEIPIHFIRNDEPKVEPNQMHFDTTTVSWDDQQQRVDKVISLGGSVLDFDLPPEELHVPVQDPEGNEFCVIEPVNNFLKDTARIGAYSSDGSQDEGYFWSAALDWPLVWDQDEETAIQSPAGGSKISWGGPPLDVRTTRTRLHFNLVPSGDRLTEIDRLVTLGANQSDDAPCQPGWTAMTTPDGHPFCLTD
ncbi:VOC family protein [Aeromicrobium panaciterrae]|uniref:VOC family protein n=1 Tax=Aeromicrobium panaciterrae TaxID=363861 RepID=UPI0031CE233A